MCNSQTLTYTAATGPQAPAVMKRAREEPAPTTSGASAGASSSSMHSRAYVGVYRTRDGQHWRAWIGFGGRHHTVGGRCGGREPGIGPFQCASN